MVRVTLLGCALLVASSVGCGMPQGVSVVESRNPDGLLGRGAFVLMAVETDRSVEKAPSQAAAFEAAFVERVVNVARGYGLDVVRDGDPRGAGRPRVVPHMWLEEVEHFYAGTVWVDIRMRVEVLDDDRGVSETVELHSGAQSGWALDCAAGRWWNDGRCAGPGVPQDPNTWPGRTVGIRFGGFLADYLRYRSTGEVRAPRG